MSGAPAAVRTACPCLSMGGPLLQFDTLPALPYNKLPPYLRKSEHDDDGPTAPQERYNATKALTHRAHA